MAKIRYDANREEQRSIEEQCCLFVHDTLKKVSPVCFHQYFKQTSTSRGPLGHHPTIQSHLGRGSCRARAKSSDALPRGEIGNNLRRWSVLKFDGAPFRRPATQGGTTMLWKIWIAQNLALFGPNLALRPYVHTIFLEKMAQNEPKWTICKKVFRHKSRSWQRFLYVV